jgi:hypothetical protein
MSALTQESAMKNCDLFFPTRDDVIGLSYLFDRLSGRKMESRTFDFDDYPEWKFARVLKKVELERKPEESGVPVVVTGIRGRIDRDIRLEDGTSEIGVREISQEDFDERILPRLREQDAELAEESESLKYLSITNSPDLDRINGISALSNLQSLFLSDTGLEKIPSEIIRLKSLSHLTIASSFLTSIPPEIARMTSLIRVDLDNNNLRTLPEEIGMLGKLENLDLSGNPIQSLPEGMRRMPALRRLRVDEKGLDENARILLNDLRSKGVRVN